MFRAISSVLCAGSLRTGSRLSKARPARKLMNLTGYKKTEAWSMMARELNLMISCPTCFELLLASRARTRCLTFLPQKPSYVKITPDHPDLPNSSPLTILAERRTNHRYSTLVRSDYYRFWLLHLRRSAGLDCQITYWQKHKNTDARYLSLCWFR